MTLLSATTVTFPESAFAPLAVGYFGLGTGASGGGMSGPGRQPGETPQGEPASIR